MAESSEISDPSIPTSEIVQSPETELFNPHLEGLQGRMLLYDEDAFSLTPHEDIKYDITQNKLGSQTFRSYRVFNYASTLERLDQWDGVDTGTDTKYQVWQKEMQRIIGGNAERAQELSVLNNRLGVDFQNFDEVAARRLYERYFKGQSEEIVIVNGNEVYIPSHIKRFVGDTLQSFTDSQGKINYDELKKHLSSIQWLSHIFGKNSSEVVTQLIDAEAQLITNPAPLIARLNQTESVTKPDGSTAEVKRINEPRLAEREVELIEFLDAQLERVRVALPPKPKDKSTDKKEFVWHYHRNNKQDNHFPYAAYAHSLLAPSRVAAKLQRDFPQQHGSTSFDKLAKEVQRDQEAIHRKYNIGGIQDVMQRALSDYGSFLAKQYGVQDFHAFDKLDVQLIGEKASQLYPRALGFMFAGAPSIYLNMKVIEDIAQREKIDLQVNPEVAIRRVLNEVIPHEYTHIIGEQAHWYLMRRNKDNTYPIETLRPISSDRVQPGKLGPLVTKPDVYGPQNNAYGVPKDVIERGRWIMEAVTVRLTQEWAEQTNLGVSKHLNAYPYERQVLDAVMDRLVREGDVPNKKAAFQYFADAYFKEGGLVRLIKTLDGATQDGERKRPHFTQTLYALMEYDNMQNTDTQYDLSRAFANGSLNDFQRGQLKRAVTESMKAEGSKVQLSPAAQAYLIKTYNLGINLPLIRRKRNPEADGERKAA
jgi:hypothetical protein